MTFAPLSFLASPLYKSFGKSQQISPVFIKSLFFERRSKKGSAALRRSRGLSINPENLRDGKEGCARGTQEGCPVPFKSKAGIPLHFVGGLFFVRQPVGCNAKGFRRDRQLKVRHQALAAQSVYPHTATDFSHHLLHIVRCHGNGAVL